jgi:hypothetical protein
MRLTINLDDDLYRMAKAFAVTEDVSISKAINTIMRRIVAPTPVTKSVCSEDSAFPVSRGRRLITSEDVHRVEEDDDLRNWAPRKDSRT